MGRTEKNGSSGPFKTFIVVTHCLAYDKERLTKGMLRSKVKCRNQKCRFLTETEGERKESWGGGEKGNKVATVAHKWSLRKLLPSKL